MSNTKNATKATAAEVKARKMAVLVVSAPGGPRRRAGFGFGPAPVELTEEQLGKDAERIMEQLRADPKLKLDMAEREVPVEEAEAEKPAE